jgi:uncharacterized protein (TIGR00369 family)
MSEEITYPPLGPSVHDLLGITLDEWGPERTVMSVEVNEKVHQPFGVLHGGVSALLIEAAASMGGMVAVGPDEIVVGTELNCSHLRSVSSGRITAIATPLRKGRRVHVWEVSIVDSENQLISTGRCSLQVIKRPTTEK